MKRIADEELRKMGVVVKDIDQPIGTLSGGSASVSRSRGPSTSGPGSSSSTGDAPRSASTS